jgi:hypothetical protein
MHLAWQWAKKRRGATLRGVALGTGHASEAAVEVSARGEVGDRAGAIEPVERAEEG